MVGVPEPLVDMGMLIVRPTPPHPSPTPRSTTNNIYISDISYVQTDKYRDVKGSLSRYKYYNLLHHSAKVSIDKQQVYLNARLAIYVREI